MTNRATVSEVRRQRAFITELDAALRSSAPGVSLRDICGQYPQESAPLKDVLSAVRNFIRGERGLM